VSYLRKKVLLDAGKRDVEDDLEDSRFERDELTVL